MKAALGSAENYCLLLYNVSKHRNDILDDDDEIEVIADKKENSKQQKKM